MKIIGIETSSIAGGVALLDSDPPEPARMIRSGGRMSIRASAGQLKEFKFTKGMVHGRYLVPAIQKGLKQLKWKMSDIDLIAVDIGPGSYTGLRVGLAVAKTMGYALNELNHKRPKVSLIGITSLDAMAENITVKYDFICPVIDARWNQVYTAIYKNNCGHYERISDYMAILPNEFIKRLPSPVFMFGDGVKRYKDIFGKPGVTFGEEKVWFPRAKYVARLGLNAFIEGKRDDPFKLVPLYLRLTEAEMKRATKRHRLQDVVVGRRK